MTIDLYYWPTPNGWKISIALEEMGLAYDTRLININKGDQHAPAIRYQFITRLNYAPQATRVNGVEDVAGLTRTGAISRFGFAFGQRHNGLGSNRLVQ